MLESSENQVGGHFFIVKLNYKGDYERYGNEIYDDFEKAKEICRDCAEQNPLQHYFVMESRYWVVENKL